MMSVASSSSPGGGGASTELPVDQRPVEADDTREVDAALLLRLPALSRIANKRERCALTLWTNAHYSWRSPPRTRRAMFSGRRLSRFRIRCISPNRTPGHSVPHRGGQTRRIAQSSSFFLGGFALDASQILPFVVASGFVADELESPLKRSARVKLRAQRRASRRHFQTLTPFRANSILKRLWRHLKSSFPKRQSPSPREKTMCVE